jgi:hypothetical protein
MPSWACLTVFLRGESAFKHHSLCAIQAADLETDDVHYSLMTYHDPQFIDCGACLVRIMLMKANSAEVESYSSRIRKMLAVLEKVPS